MTKTIDTVADLAQYAEEVYAAGWEEGSDLPETPTFGRTNQDPWSTPGSFVDVELDGADLLTRDPDGNWAKWDNDDRGWEEITFEAARNLAIEHINYAMQHSDFLDLFFRTAGGAKRYEVRYISGDTGAEGKAALSQIIAEDDDYATAKSWAQDMAYDFHYGTAVVDSEDQWIDWGSDFTNFDGDDIERPEGV